MHKTVTLSDGLPCRVRQLGLYELNGKAHEVIGPYRYSLLLATGQIIEDEYDIRALDYTPTPPDTPREEITQGSPEWYQLEEYETYLCAVTHEKKRIESYHGHVDDVIAYILANCVNPDDHSRIVMLEDWAVIYQAVFAPELTWEEVANTLKSVFQGFLWWSRGVGRPFKHLQGGREGGINHPVGA